MPLKVKVVNSLRSAVPSAVVPALIAARTSRALRNPAVAATFHEELSYLLEGSDRASEIPALVPARARWKMRRGELRYHPEAITNQRVEGLEVLTGRDTSRPLLLSFAHHAHYDGMFASIERHGPHLDAVINPVLLDPHNPAPWVSQHVRVIRWQGSDTVTVDGGVKALAARMHPAGILAIAADVGGSAVRTFLGSEFKFATGPVRIAAMTDSPIVVATQHPENNGQDPYVHLSDPIDPRDYPDVDAVLDAVLAVHEPAILAWPEASEDPTRIMRRSDDDRPNQR